jgi:hypothetical protein
VIRKTPGATYYDISKALNWDVKKAKRTAAKLEATGRVQLIESERNHRKIVQVIEIDKPRPTSRLYPNYRTWYYKGEFFSRDEAYRKYFEDCDRQKSNDKPNRAWPRGRTTPLFGLDEIWSVNPRGIKPDPNPRKIYYISAYIDKSLGKDGIEPFPINETLASGHRREIIKLYTEKKLEWISKGYYNIHVLSYVLGGTPDDSYPYLFEREWEIERLPANDAC